MPFDLTVSKGATPPRNPVDAKKAAFSALKDASARASGKEPAAIVKYIPSAECPDRIGIEFDDSGSMSWQIENAKQGLVEFLRNCIPNQTAVAVHFMNTQPHISLQSDLVRLGMEIQEKHLSSGGTPFFNTMKKMLEAVPKYTRLVVFTDGSPTDSLQAEESTEMMWGYNVDWIQSARIIVKINKALNEKCVPIDTIFFGGASGSEREIALLKFLSEETGGYFLHFDPAKVNFKTAFKYLAPVNRLMLASESFRADVESGRKA